MRRRIGVAVLGALTLAFGLAASGCGGTQKEDKAPAPAPDYAARTLAGDSVSLASLRGQVVLLNIWATWCVPCRQEMPMLQQIHEKNQARGLKVVGISVDAHGNESRIRSFISEFGLTFTIWSDPDERAMFQFRAVGVPATILVDRAGNIAWQRVGYLDETHARELGSVLEKALTAG